MIEQSFGKNYSQFVNVLIFIFPVVINSLKVAGDLVLFVLAMMGVFVAISQKLSPFIIKEIKVFSYLTSGYFFTVCLSVIFSDKSAELAHFISRDLYFLFAPFIALSLYKAKINVNYLLTGVKVGLIVIGIVMFNQLEAGYHRTSDNMSPVIFGNLTVSMFFIVLAFFHKEQFKHKIFTSISLLSGFFAIVQIGSRASWLSLLLLLGFYFYFYYKNKISKKIPILFVLFIALFVLSVFNFSQYANHKINLAYTQTSNYLSGDNELNSVSERLETYKFAIENIKDIPFFGYGLRTSNIVLSEKTSNANIKRSLSYNHLHNAYLTNLYNGGIPLFVALLFLLLTPFRIFIKANRENDDEPVFIAGSLLTMSFIFHGIFGPTFGGVFMNAFYVFFLAIFLILSAKSTKVL